MHICRNKERLEGIWLRVAFRGNLVQGILINLLAIQLQAFNYFCWANIQLAAHSIYGCKLLNVIRLRSPALK